MRRYGTLYLLLILPLAFFAIFRYYPMAYVLQAFKKNNILIPPWQVEWAKNDGFQWFIKAFSDKNFIQALKNTIFLNLLDLVIGMPMPILMALLLNELAFPKYKRVTQTILYLPHFLSWVIIFGICTTMLGESTGVVNNLIKRMGGSAIPFLSNKNYIRGVLIGTSLWQGLGWSSIIFLAAIAGIDTSMYEAATIDGCGRFRKIWYITLPNLGRIFVVLLITKVGRILDGGFEQVYIFLNDRVSSTAQIIDTWVYTQGLGKQQYSLTTAVGLLKSVLSCGLVLGTNALARKWDSSLW
jgi:ABC-type polysaccharide transport system, permease component